MSTNIIISVFIWLASGLLTVLLFLVVFILTILFLPFDKNKQVTHAQCYWWSDLLIAINPFWSVSVAGLENIDHKQTYVIIANHQSMADIVALYKIRMQFKWVAKASLFRVPCIGWCLSLIKHIKLLRGDYSSIKEIYHQASFWLQRNVSVLFFPEGTRGSQLGEFQNGAFKFAIKEKKPILPVCVKGTAEAIPKGSWIFRTKAAAQIIVLAPVPTDSYGPGDFALLRDMVRGRIKEALDKEG